MINQKSKRIFPNLHSLSKNDFIDQRLKKNREQNKLRQCDIIKTTSDKV